MPPDKDRAPLPFEPNRKQKKPPKEKAATSQKREAQPKAQKKVTKPKAAAPQKVETASRQTPKASKRPEYTREETSIPEVISRRMLRRMVFFSGVPVTVGILTFFGSYVVITQEIADLPNVVVLLVTLACFGLSVAGLTYGALSASWEEETLGTMVGFDQFQLNAGRLLDSWREAREARRGNS